MYESKGNNQKPCSKVMEELYNWKQGYWSQQNSDTSLDIWISLHIGGFKLSGVRLCSYKIKIKTGVSH